METPNPKEKANELVKSFLENIPHSGRGSADEDVAKSCAETCVDEMISTLSDFQGIGIDSQGTLEDEYKFWKEVKKELQTL